MQPSLSKFIKITPCSRATKLVNFQIKSTLSNESWNQILPSLSQSFPTHHPNVFTPILSLSEGRAGIAWVPSNKMLFPPLRYKTSLAVLHRFSLYFYSYIILSDSLSLSLWIQRVKRTTIYDQSGNCRHGLDNTVTVPSLVKQRQRATNMSGEISCEELHRKCVGQRRVQGLYNKVDGASDSVFW
jgi:hypothetical protein